MRLVLAFLLTLLTGCAESRLDQKAIPEPWADHTFDQSNSGWSEKRKALYEQAREGLRLSRERYLATTRPVLERKFRQEHPELSGTEIDLLVNEALAQGYSYRTEPRPDGPARLPPPRPMNCFPSPGGWPSGQSCY